MLTEHQRLVLTFASEQVDGIGKGDFPPAYRRRPRSAWWRNLDQLEARGLVYRIGDKYVATPAGDAALSQDQQ